MEESDPSLVVRGKKQIVEADAPGSVPMVPMGMPMSPHMPGQPAQPVDGQPAHLLADPLYLPDQGFGGDPGLPQMFSGVESSAMTPMEPAVFAPTLPATPAMPVTPAMHGTPAVPATPLSEALVRPVDPLQPHILPAGVEPGELATPLAGGDSCCCCGNFHDGQEYRPFNRDDAAGQGTPDGQPAGEPQHLAHDNQGVPASQPGTPQGEVTKPVPTDQAPDSDSCCACCGDKHPGLENSPNDSLTTDPGKVTEPGDTEDSEDSEDSADDDCPHDDDEKPGEQGEHSGDGADDHCPRDDSSHEKPGELPATEPATSGDVPLSPRTLPAPADSSPSGLGTPPVQGTPQSALTPRTATQPESAYQVEPMQAGQAKQGELLQPKAGEPLTALRRDRGTPLQPTALSRVEAPKSPSEPQQLKPLTSSSKPVTPGQYNAFTPPVSGAPAESNTTPAEPKQFYTSSGAPNENTPASEETTTNPGVLAPRQRVQGTPKEQSTTPKSTGGSPAYTSGNPYSSGSPYPGAPGATGVPQDGNVGPDPNVKFDEASFNQLIGVIGGMKSTLDDAYMIDVVYLDAELLLQPTGQKWDPAVKLVTRGGNFGGSVETQSEALGKTLSTFHSALEQAKAVFKDTDDLAAYDATKFTTEYPGFSSGPGVV